MKIITKNKRAFHDYEIKYKVQAGIVLKGDEVKSIRQGNISITDSFATVRGGEIMLINFYIAPYSHAYTKKDESRRSRKLLLHKREIAKLIGEVSRKGLTLIPLVLYFSSRGHVKVELGVGKSKKKADKKRELKEKDIKRHAEREMKIRIK